MKSFMTLVAALALSLMAACPSDDKEKPKTDDDVTVTPDTGEPDDVPVTPDDVPDTADADDVPGPGDTGGDTGPVETSGIQVLSEDARSCEILIKDAADTIVTDVTFDADLGGTFERRPPHTAIGFHAIADGSIAAGAVAIVVKGGDATKLEIVHAKCFDRLGAAIDGDAVEIRE